MRNFVANFVRILGICKVFARNRVNELGNVLRWRYTQLRHNNRILSLYGKFFRGRRYFFGKNLFLSKNALYLEIQMQPVWKMKS